MLLHVFQMIATILYALSSDVYTILNYMTFVIILIDTLCMAGMLHMRVTQPQRHRPLKVRARDAAMTRSSDLNSCQSKC